MNLAMLLLGLSTALAADHIDSPGAVADPAADITDLLAWTNANGTKINLIMNVGPLGTATACRQAVTMRSTSRAPRPAAARAPSPPSPVSSTTRREHRVLGAGRVRHRQRQRRGRHRQRSLEPQGVRWPRNDPFFMEFTGFVNAEDAVMGVVPDGTRRPAHDRGLVEVEGLDDDDMVHPSLAPLADTGQVGGRGARSPGSRCRR